VATLLQTPGLIIKEFFWTLLQNYHNIQKNDTYIKTSFDVINAVMDSKNSLAETDS